MSEKQELEKRPAFLESYIKSYPKNKVFYVTTDKMVFLDGDKNLAYLHERESNADGKVQTYKI